MLFSLSVNCASTSSMHIIYNQSLLSKCVRVFFVNIDKNDLS